MMEVLLIATMIVVLLAGLAALLWSLFNDRR
jgi:hypothetical protein